RTDRLGKVIQLRDVYGNTHTYAHLKKLSIAYPVTKEKTVTKTHVHKVVLKRLKPGSKVIAGTILGRIGRTEQKMAPHMLFEVSPAGRGAPRIDPKPITEGWT